MEIYQNNHPTHQSRAVGLIVLTVKSGRVGTTSANGKKKKNRHKELLFPPSASEDKYNNA